MKIMNPRFLLLILSLAGICATCLAIQTGYARSGAIRRPNHDRVGSTVAHWVWQNPLPQGNTLYGVSFTDSNTGTATGDNGTIIRTTNGGNTWVSQTSGTTNNLNAVSFTDANNGTAVSWYGIILRTTDSGATWVSQTSGTESFLYGVSFTDANNGTAVGEGGTILRTTDSGSNWVSQTSGTKSFLWGVSFTDANNGTAIG